MKKLLTEDEIYKLNRDFENAKSAKPLDGNKKAELEYGRAYQALVRTGLKPQIKKKYRKGI